jgi:integrase
MLYSGLRTQELLALTKDDIAFDGSVIRVNKAIKTVNGKPTLGTPKSKTSNRTIPIPADKRKYAVYLRENGGSEFIWSIHSKNPLYSVGSFRRRYYTAIKKIAVRPLSPHCCRHTYVTRLQARGVPMEIIANLVGHSEVNTTNIYLHTSLETLQDAVLVFNN